MMRRLDQLEKEIKDNGLSLPSGKYSKDDLIPILREFYWTRDHAGEKRLNQIAPMLARSSKDMPADEMEALWNNPSYIAQKKLNGLRAKLHINPFGDGTNRIDSRNISVKNYMYHEFSANIPHLRRTRISENLEKEWAGTVLDGEMISDKHAINTAINGEKGETTVSQLQAVAALVNCEAEKSIAIQKREGVTLTLVLFDILFYKGEDIRNKSYLFRMTRLEEFNQAVARNVSGLIVEPVVHGSAAEKKKFFKDYVASGGEGIMLKDLDSPYQGDGRPRSWYKVKKSIDVDGFVTGYIPGEDGFTGLVGAFKISAMGSDGKPREIGAVSHMPLEFRKLVSAPDGSLKQEYYNRVIAVTAIEWSKNLRLSHCVPQDTNDMFRSDKGPEDCYVDFDAVADLVMSASRGE